jgi:hypothetical protein
MRITNKHNLPEPFVHALGLDEYERGDADFTTTELQKPVRIAAYTKSHWDEMEEDVSERIWAFTGQVKHIILERIARSDPQRYIAERRYTIEIPEQWFPWTDDGPVRSRKISGKIDLYDKKTRVLYDYKETSVWKFILGDTREWEEQANTNLYLMRMNDVHPEKLVNVALLKDWKARLARMTRRKDYPQCAINLCELPMWSVGQQQDFILKRIGMHEMLRGEPPVCTKKERWQRDATFAVMRKGRKAALRLCDNKDQAEAIAASYNSDTSRISGQHYIEERPCEPVRCLDFCPVQQYCDFGIAAVKRWREQDEATTRNIARSEAVATRPAGDAGLEGA